MNLKLKTVWTTSFALITSFSHLSWAGSFDQLKPEEKNLIISGNPLLYVSDEPQRPSSAWPKYQVIQLILATPEESAAVFFDFKAQQSYLPDLIESIVTPTGKNSVDVDYSVRLPFFMGVEKYTIHDVVTAENGAYEVKWTGIPNDSFDFSEGSAYFEPLGDNTTLLTYTSFVEPTRNGSSLPWVIDRVKDHLLTTVRLIEKHIESEKSSDSPLLNEEIQALRKALAP